MHVYYAQLRCVLFRWEYDPKKTQGEEECVCIASVETLYENKRRSEYELNEIDYCYLKYSEESMVGFIKM